MAVSNAELHRELGEQGQRLEALEHTLEEQTGKLDELVKWKNQLEGGKKAVVIAIAAATTVGGLISWAMSHLTWKG